ncbi:copper resistance protein B [Pinirhizobacter soli]|uniref:copper resistance protein B n=1 Tax=Pinirhizobacter soli TaxID=2786953 RepID=UPI00202A0C9A|nr:copper resistance protein B [Pinirhizobacter soli]
MKTKQANALLAASLLVASGVAAQTEHQAHDMHDMSGMQGMSGMPMPQPAQTPVQTSASSQDVPASPSTAAVVPNGHVAPAPPSTYPTHPGMGEMDMHATPFNVFTRVDELERGFGTGSAVTSFNAGGWIGGDLDRFAWRAEGELERGTDDASVEAFYSHAVAAFWNIQAGVRQDVGDGASRSWAAFGVHGLAPYWFDLEATAYLGQGGRTAVRVEARYEVLFTQRLVLTPKFELNAYGKSDPSRDIGSGVSDVEAGLRLRYEFTRRFAPYLGLDWQRRLGNTASMARAQGQDAGQWRWVAGLRLWF